MSGESVGRSPAWCAVYGLLALVPALAIPQSLGAQDVDTVRVGSAALRGAALRAGSYVVESFQRAEGRDTPISVTRQAVTRERQGDHDVYVIHTTHSSSDGDTTVSTIVVRASDFGLLHQRVKASRDSAAVTANGGYLTGWVVLPDEPIRLLDQPLSLPVFPVEGQIPWLFPLLPLAAEYRAAIPHYSPWDGGERWSTIRVVGVETVEIDGRVVECWKVDGGELFPGYHVTYWIDKDTRRVAQGVARGAEGEPEYWSRARSR